ncbi:MAG: hypothetical protein JW806_08175 [Sedimentisphaerales bacterium]|nr:hypothetical protein [Sedimentisphaerales bacterium]
MKLKWVIIAVLLTVFISSNGFSATIARWKGAPAEDANKTPGTGSWKDAYWLPGPSIPPAPANADGEIKIVEQNAVCTVDSDIGEYICKMSIAGGNDMNNMPKLEIVEGGQLGIGEFRVGAGGSANSGPMGCVNQTGGTLILANDLKIGRSSTSQKNPNDGKGFYTISGGTIKYKANTSKGRILVGGNGTGDDLAEGTLTIVGSNGRITIKQLFVGNDGRKKPGRGTLEFQLDSKGVSPIQTDLIYLDMGEDDVETNLAVSAIAVPPQADIVLVENQGVSRANGRFDKVNGQTASEGANVTVNFDGTDYKYSLTYQGGDNRKSIALKFKTAVPAVKAETEAKK